MRRAGPDRTTRRTAVVWAWNAVTTAVLLLLSALVLHCLLGEPQARRRGAEHAPAAGPAAGDVTSAVEAVAGTSLATTAAQAVQPPHTRPPPPPAPPVVEADPYVHTRPADQHSRAQKRGGLLIPSFDNLPKVKAAQAKQRSISTPAQAAGPSAAGLATPPSEGEPVPPPRDEPSTWDLIESTVGSGPGTDDDWRQLAGNITFQAESPAIHGAQALVHTLRATDVKLKKIDISWVTQLTPDRLYLLKQMLDRWEGPASATIYVHDLAEALKLLYPLRQRVDFHLVLADLHAGRLYPVNTLRNVAINKCRTHWMALVDADFIPNADLYVHLVKHVNDLQGNGDDSIYILPAFQLQPSKGGTTVPMTKPELLQMGDKVSQVHPEKGRDIAHSPTDYIKWREATEPYTIQYRMPYEPYYVANKRIPRYDASFLGYGNDKTGQCYEVWKAGIKFTVLPFAFVFHMDHPRGDWLKSDVEWSIRGPQALDTFFADVDRKYVGSQQQKDLKITATVSGKGRNCTSACEDAGLGCWGSKSGEVNNCGAMEAAFGSECTECSDAFFGHDLPALNHAFKKCLINQKPEEYRLSCAAHEPNSVRLCPCGEALSQWLTESWVHAFKAEHRLFGGKP